MTDTIAHPPLPEPAAHMHPNDIRLFAAGIDINAPAYPDAFQFHGGSSVPLFTAQQMREYRDAPAWLPIETAPKTSKAQLVWVPDNHCVFLVCWDLWGVPGWVHFGDDSGSDRLDQATLWMPLPAAPIEQAAGEKL